MTTLDIDIAVKDAEWRKSIADIENQTRSIAKETIEHILPLFEHIEISIVLADNSFVQGLNKKYRHKDKATNVLSFPQTQPEDLKIITPFLCLGDVILAHETIKKEAQNQKKTINDHYTHMLIHGCLHLLHYDHISEEEAQEMETLEIKILKTMGIKNPYETY